MEPSQLFLRSLKVIKESNKRHKSNHCNKTEALATKKLIKRNQMGEDLRRMEGGELARQELSEQLRYGNCGIPGCLC